MYPSPPYVHLLELLEEVDRERDGGGLPVVGLSFTLKAFML